MIIKIKPRDIFKIAFCSYFGWTAANMLDRAVCGAIVMTIDKHRKAKEEEIKEEE